MMNTKFNIKQLLSTGMALLVVSLGARCGGVSQEAHDKALAVLRGQIDEARDEGLLEGNRMAMESYGANFSDDFNGIKRDLALITIDELIKKVKNLEDSENNETRNKVVCGVGGKSNGGVLNRVVGVLVSGGKKSESIRKRGAIKGRKPGWINLNENALRVSKNSNILRGVSCVLTPAVFSKNDFYPQERVPMLMYLLGSIAELVDKFNDLVAKEERYRIAYDAACTASTGGNENEFKTKHREVGGAYGLFGESCDAFDESVAGYVSRQFLVEAKPGIPNFEFDKDGELSEKGVIQIGTTVRVGEKLERVINSKLELLKAIAYFKQAYTMAAVSISSLKKMYGLCLENLEYRTPAVDAGGDEEAKAVVVTRENRVSSAVVQLQGTTLQGASAEITQNRGPVASEPGDSGGDVRTPADVQQPRASELASAVGASQRTRPRTVETGDSVGGSREPAMVWPGQQSDSSQRASGPRGQESNTAESNTAESSAAVSLTGNVGRKKARQPRQYNDNATQIRSKRGLLRDEIIKYCGGDISIVDSVLSNAILEESDMESFSNYIVTKHDSYGTEFINFVFNKDDAEHNRIKEIEMYIYEFLYDKILKGGYALRGSTGGKELDSEGLRSLVTEIVTAAMAKDES